MRRRTRLVSALLFLASHEVCRVDAVFMGGRGPAIKQGFSREIQLAGPPAPGRWVYVMPFAIGQPAPLLTVGEKATSVPLAGIKPGLAMICAGGEKVAT